MGCCPACGKPWERVVELVGGRTKGRTPERQAVATKIGKPNGASYGSGLAVDDIATHKTLGWRPACDCPEAEPVPCTVLDPFNGTGTTGVVACRHGRNYIGIELFEKYAEISERRIYRALKPQTYRADIDPGSPLFAHAEAKHEQLELSPAPSDQSPA